MKIVKTGDHKPVEQDGMLLVTIESNTREELDDVASKRLAQTVDKEFNYDNSGIENYGSTFLLPTTKKDAKPVYGRTYRITKGIPGIF